MSNFEHPTQIDANPAAVRAALVTASGIQGWWAQDSDVSEAIGGRHELRFQKGENTVVMGFTVDTLDDDRISWTCTDNGNPVWVDTTLEWRLTPVGGGTRVDFAHRGLTMVGSPPYQMTVDTWPAFCASLKAYVETGTGQPW